MLNKNIVNYIACDADYEDSKVVLFGVPFDSTTSFRPGTRFASNAIRTESYGLETYSPYQDKDLTDCKIFDSGDLELAIGNSEIVLKEIENRTEIILNDEKTVYAKRTPIGDIEPDTTPFVSKDKVMSELYENFKPNDVDKYTVVVYLEGDDPQCINDILGGEMKMDMLIGENTLKYER